MKAMVYHAPGQPLMLMDRPVPAPAPEQVLVRVRACGVCRTDLHLIDGELPETRMPVIPGHQIVGIVEKVGSQVSRFQPGDRVGIPWLGWTCGSCRHCRSEQENLCDQARFTGCHLDGGFAEHAVADQRYCFALPDAKTFPDTQAAPLLCAGLIGYRAYRMAGEARTIGFYGFGAAAHILIQVARHQARRIFAFTRPDDHETQDYARRLGAAWAGGSNESPPEPLDAAIIFAAVGSLVPAALAATVKGGVVICAGIHMSDIPSFPYRLLWNERSVKSVANLTRRDGEEFLALAPRIPVKTDVEVFPLENANEALAALRTGAIRGAAVLRVGTD